MAYADVFRLASDTNYTYTCYPVTSKDVYNRQGGHVRGVCVGCNTGMSEDACVENMTGRLDRLGGVYVGCK